MLRYLIQRIAMLFPLLIGITLITFVVIHLAPGEPVEMQTAMNHKVSAQPRERLREFYGLDKPVHVQYLTWLGRLARLDFGRSFAPDNRPVIDKVRERIPVTLSLNVIALALEFGLAIPIGILAATRRDTLLDKGITLFVFLGFAVPTFWLALILMYLFGVKLGWLPISGLHSLGSDKLHGLAWFWDLARHLILPIAIASFGSLAGLSRYMRSTMLEVIGQDYITTARAKGLTERVVIYRHALRNALLPAHALEVVTTHAYDRRGLERRLVADLGGANATTVMTSGPPWRWRLPHARTAPNALRASSAEAPIQTGHSIEFYLGSRSSVNRERPSGRQRLFVGIRNRSRCLLRRIA